MSPPRVGPIEIPPVPRAAQKSHPGREPSDPPLPEVDFSPEEQSTAQQVATFKTSRVQVGLPSAVLLAIVAACSAAVVAWINKPPPPVVSPLTADQSRQLEACSRMAQDVAELKATVKWIEPQIGILLVRTDSRGYTPPPPRAPDPLGVGVSKALAPR